jgi:hypothetical protein
MQNLSWYWNRVRSMNSSEIAWRIQGLLRDQLDAIRFPLGLEPKLTRYPEQTEFQPGFQCSPLQLENWRSSTTAPTSQWLARLTAKADQILENRLSYFDLREVNHGDPVNWHRDFSARKNAPVKLSLRTDYRDFATNGECKYAMKVAKLLRSWIDANPFAYGMHWKSPLELGIRLINWVWAIDLIRSEDVIDDDLFGTREKSNPLSSSFSRAPGTSCCIQVRIPASTKKVIRMPNSSAKSRSMFVGSNRHFSIDPLR